MSHARLGRFNARLFAGVAVGCLVAAIAVLVALFDWNWLKRPIERAVSGATGRELVIGGNVSGTWHWRPLLRLESVRLSNPPWAADPQLLEADVVELQPRLLPLLRGRLHLDVLYFERPRVSLERAPDGRATWYLDRDQDDPRSSPVIDSLRVVEGKLRYRSLAEGSDFEARLSEDPGLEAGRALSFEAAGKIRSLPFKAKGSTASLLHDLEQRLPVKATGVVAKTRFSVDGTITGVQRFEQAELRYQIAGSTLKTLGQLFDAPLPETPPYRISGVLLHSKGEWASDDLKGRIGSSDVAGNVKLTTSGAKPFLEVRLDSSLLDLADLGPLIGYAPQAEAGNRLLPARNLDMARIDKLDAHVLIRARRVVRPGDFPFDDFTADLRLRDSRITIDPLNFGMADGKLALRVELDARGPLSSHLRGSLRDVRLSKIFTGNRKFGEAAGLLTGHIDLRGRGDSVAAMVGHSDGRVAMLLTDGHVPSMWPALADLDGARVLAAFLKGASPESVTCTAVDLQIEHGVATPRIAVVETDTTVIAMTGTANLDAETLDLRLEQAPKKPSFLSIRTPLRLTGPMQSPRFSLEPGPLGVRAAAGIGLAAINPLLALFALVETGPGKDGACPGIGRAIGKS